MNRVIGPVQGVSNMIDEDRYCVDILVQIQAARSALHQVSIQGQAVDTEQKNTTPMNQRELRLNENGSGGRTRTYDQVINSHPLCQLSYSGTKYKSAANDLKKIVWPPISVKPSTSIGVVFLEGVAARWMAQFL